MTDKNKINQLDRRWATNLQNEAIKIDRQLSRLEKMLSPFTKIKPVSTNLRHVQVARKEIAALADFANFTKQIANHAEELKA